MGGTGKGGFDAQAFETMVIGEGERHSNTLREHF